MQPLVILTGPTAVGKTALSVQLAKRINGEIISADALQVYKYMDIGTAKVTEQEMEGVKHYLIDVLEPTQEFNAAAFKKMADAAIETILSKGKIPIITGGTGFYIQAVLYDIAFEDTVEADTEKDLERSELREKFKLILREHGNEYIHNMLNEVDSKAAQAIHPNNAQRVIRALEYYYTCGEKFSEYNERQKERKAAFNFAYFVLNDERNRLYERIDRRVDVMFENGLLEEMDRLAAMGLTREHQSMQAIGYRELFAYRSGAATLEETKELIKQNSRHYAKRQLTWFRREQGVDWILYKDFDYDKEKILDYMTEVLENKGIL
jgi:tRNA dimethylallyltransferase